MGPPAGMFRSPGTPNSESTARSAEVLLRRSLVRSFDSSSYSTSRIAAMHANQASANPFGADRAACFRMTAAMTIVAMAMSHRGEGSLTVCVKSTHPLVETARTCVPGAKEKQVVAPLGGTVNGICAL